METTIPTPTVLAIVRYACPYGCGPTITAEQYEQDRRYGVTHCPSCQWPCYYENES